MFFDDITDWGIPKFFISDKNKKFISDSWKTVLGKFGVVFLINIVYHPQTDGQNEKTNQTVKSVLKYWMTSHSGENWTKFLPRLKSIFNNMANISTNSFPNEIIYGYKLKNTLFLLMYDPTMDENATNFLVKKTNITKKTKKMYGLGKFENKIII